MTERKVRVTEYTCDGCGVRRYSPDDDAEVLGYFGGPVSAVTGTSGNSIKSWYACSEDRIQSAVVNALRRAWCGCKTGCEQCE